MVSKLCVETIDTLRMVGSVKNTLTLGGSMLVAGQGAEQALVAKGKGGI